MSGGRCPYGLPELAEACVLLGAAYQLHPGLSLDIHDDNIMVRDADGQWVITDPFTLYGKSDFLRGMISQW